MRSRTHLALEQGRADLAPRHAAVGRAYRRDAAGRRAPPPLRSRGSLAVGRVQPTTSSRGTSLKKEHLSFDVQVWPFAANRDPVAELVASGSAPRAGESPNAARFYTLIDFAVATPAILSGRSETRRHALLFSCGSRHAGARAARGGAGKCSGAVCSRRRLPAWRRCAQRRACGRPSGTRKAAAQGHVQAQVNLSGDHGTQR